MNQFVEFKLLVLNNRYPAFKTIIVETYLVFEFKLYVAKSFDLWPVNCSPLNRVLCRHILH